MRWLIGLAVVVLAACSPDSDTDSASPTTAPSGSEAAATDTFQEDFAWRGEHAATLAEGGNSVWWDANRWDVRSDTHSIAVTPGGLRPDGSDFPWKGHSIDVQKAASSDDTDHVTDRTASVLGGDGSPGMGVMHLDNQGILSARLRNPMVISADKPGMVEFFAPTFVTTGHWWEVAITPSTSVAAGEYSAVPGRQDNESLDDPVTVGGGGSTNGPGHHQFFNDAINVISTGWPDIPDCRGEEKFGWFARYAATRARPGEKIENHVRAVGDVSKLFEVDPKNRKLVPWRITYATDSITLEIDVENDGKWEPVDKWALEVPWPEVHVHLLYAAYQADHHPQVGCGYDQDGNNVTQVQETQWRQVSVAPVKYGTTVALPRTTAERRTGGWLSFDLRDIQRHGSSGGRPQPNAAAYDKYASYAWCSKLDEGALRCGDKSRARSEVSLPVTVEQRDLDGLARLQLVADIRSPGTVTVEVNGTKVGVLPPVPATTPKSPAGHEFEPEAWVRRSLDVDPKLLRPGANTVRLLLSPDTLVEIDRIELELSIG